MSSRSIAAEMALLAAASVSRSMPPSRSIVTTMLPERNSTSMSSSPAALSTGARCALRLQTYPSPLPPSVNFKPLK